MSHNTFRSKFEYALPSLKAHRINEVIAPTIQPDILNQVAQKFIASLKPEALKAFNGRLERGLELARNGAVQSIPDAAHPRRFLVRSSDGTQYYKVDSDARTCECPDSQKGHICKHRISAYYIEQTTKLKSQVSQAQPPNASLPVKPTCSVPPQQPNVKPTCSIPPTRKECEQAEKRAPVNPTKEQAEKAPTARTEEQILKELGFVAEPKKVQEKATESPVQLGNLYRRYLHGSDLGEQTVKVTILDVTKEKVMPHPSLPLYRKILLVGQRPAWRTAHRYPVWDPRRGGFDCYFRQGQPGDPQGQDHLGLSQTNQRCWTAESFDPLHEGAMNYPPLPDELAQLPLIGLDPSISLKVISRRKQKVEETFAKIRQLHDELNAQLYTSPAQRPAIHSPSDAANILNYFIGALDHEEMWVVDLDTRNRVMSLVKLYQGSVNSSQVRVSEVFRQAILENAPAIIVAHNHPSGDISPSPEDINVTRAILQAGKLLDIDLLDHLIVSQGRYSSLKEKGLGFS